ncbi:hypothetical protein CBM2634_U310001 [Cupriavidus taiwanensis]|uniref:Uncharacterized protein n=1 Tax=Cupriavidus taiwanensis TaxID=164546 RepID=A0A375JFK2_9BURK|nr:hypothetical protein CBM2634_U310001 [Cupriavidus taiwanensis]
MVPGHQRNPTSVPTPNAILCPHRNAAVEAASFFGQAEAPEG